MAENAQTRPPSLIVVTGRPGSGKTSLAHSLARTLRCPALCRDEIKEGLVNTTGIRGEPADHLAGKVNEAFFDAVNLLLDRRITLIIEAAFQHKLWAPRLELLREIARVRIIVCTVDSDLARSREVNRDKSDPARAEFHYSGVVEAIRGGGNPPLTDYEPPRIDAPTLIVNTTDGYLPALEMIVAFARS